MISQLTTAEKLVRSYILNCWDCDAPWYVWCDICCWQFNTGIMMTSSNGNVFRVTSPLCGGIHRFPVNSPHKGQWRGTLIFSLICALDKRLTKQWWGWWFETLSGSLWRHCNVILSMLQGYQNNALWTNSKDTTFRLSYRLTAILFP